MTSDNIGGSPAVDQERDLNDLEALLQVVPPRVERAVRSQDGAGSLIEVILDLGRPPEARFADRDAYLDPEQVTAEDLQYVTNRISPFGDDNRAGIERTLHRISAIRNRAGEIIGLTCRVGRAIHGSARVVEDLAIAGNSVLLVGRPGVGKTTILRELARVLADTAKKHVVIVDTSNEIAGDGDIPHPAIGKSRRMQVRTPAQQHAVMIEAVENHMPEVIVVDEMGTELEALAARTIAERGVQLIATAHGNTLENLLVNPTLSDLVGGIQTVTLGDDEARRRRTQKTILERKAPPTFDVLVEIQSWNRVAVHADVAKTVDSVLRGRSVSPEIRELDASGAVRRSYQRPTVPPEFEVAPFGDAPGRSRSRYDDGPDTLGQRIERVGDWDGPLGAMRMDSQLLGGQREDVEADLSKPTSRIFPFGVSRERLQQSAASAGLPIAIADNVQKADLVLTTKAHFRRRAGVLQAAEEQGKPVFVLRRNTPGQIVGFLEQVTQPANGDDDGRSGVGTSEAEVGVERILTGDADVVELQPQSSYIRRIQHRIAERASLRSHSVGREPRRRVTIRRRRRGA
jgi:stage III sporulation protein SpoIIIAA